MFRMILHEMIATTGGALAALFLDFEGETVELVCEHDISDHDLRILGAYQGIFMSKLRELCDAGRLGAPQRFKIEFAQSSVLSFDVRDGYYVVLLVDARANEGLAWRRLEDCRAKLLAEM
jgi:predicted regulator of Ras-like GTPase activity (Roadblock/LC7/MglB family)